VRQPKADYFTVVAWYALPLTNMWDFSFPGAAQAISSKRSLLRASTKKFRITKIYPVIVPANLYHSILIYA